MRPNSQLCFDDLPLFGREAEIQSLQRALERVERSQQPEAVFISGDSGSGKTSLAHVLRSTHGCDQSANNQSLYFASGKFDAFSQGPYAAIVDALSDLCGQVASSNDVDYVRANLCQLLGGEDLILRKALPRIESILGSPSNTMESVHNDNFAFARLTISFRALLRATLCSGKTVVLVIDDLHWSDRETWDLIRDFMSDTELTRLLMIGTYRNREVSAYMAGHVSELIELFHCEVVHLDDLKVEQLNILVATVLHASPDRTMQLTSLVHQKTAGNPHFALNFLKATERRGLISYSTTALRWEWDLFKLQSETDIEDNIVDFYVAKIHTLPAHTRDALIIGACLGAKFDALLVELLLLNIELPYSVSSLNRGQLACALEQACEEGILVRQHGSMVYRFAHDKIHQALYSLVPCIANKDELHFRVGCILLMHRENMQSSQDSYQDWLTFLTASQLNLGSSVSLKSMNTIDLAKLNRDAAKAALNASAYWPALEFLSHGVELLDDWTQNELKLELMTLLARTSGCLGNFTQCYLAVDEIMRNARSVNDMIPVFVIHFDALFAEDRVNECIEKGFDFVNRLGVKLPKKITKLSVVLEMMKTKKVMSGKSEVDLLNYPLANDPAKIAAVKIINSMVTVAFFAQMRNLVATLAFINMQLIMKYGFTVEAGSIVAVYGSILAFIGEFDKGYQLGLVALKLTESSEAGLPRTYMNFYNALGHLKNPLRHSLEPLLRGYHASFGVGDTLYGFFCCHFYLSIKFFVGSQLKSLLKDMDAFSKDMKPYRARTAMDLITIRHQAVINLTSETEIKEPTTLSGRAMNEDVFSRTPETHIHEALWFEKLMLGLYFNELDVILHNLDKLVFTRQEGIDGSSFYVYTLLWIEAFGSILAAKSTKSRKYLAIARKRIKKIKDLAKHYSVNCAHYLLFLEAELAAYKRRSSHQVTNLYEATILACRQEGFTNVAALSNERAAMYLLSISQRNDASNYMQKAVELYNDWGAISKSRKLINDFGYLWSDREVSFAISFKSETVRSTVRSSSTSAPTVEQLWMGNYHEQESSRDDWSHTISSSRTTGISTGASIPSSKIGSGRLPSISVVGPESLFHPQINGAESEEINSNTLENSETSMLGLRESMLNVEEVCIDSF